MRSRLRSSENRDIVAIMGIWGISPLENDAALDWVEALFDETKLLPRIEAALQLDVRKHRYEVRAACHLVYTLVKADLWPHSRRIQFVEIAAIRLEQLLAVSSQQGARLTSELHREIEALRDMIYEPVPAHRPGLQGPDPL